jgi:hypothetical protein
MEINGNRSVNGNKGEISLFPLLAFSSDFTSNAWEG